MLGLATTAFTVALVLFNTIGLSLAAHRLTGHYALSRVAAPLALALVMFFCEHFAGFGRLVWCWPLTTAASAWIVARDMRVLREHWRLEIVVLASFAWVFAWRLSFPGLVASSEKIGDLAMISSYLPGHRLPPPDAWLPPFPFDVYYSFQHYAAALLGRIFNLSPGLTYNLAFCLLVSLTIVAAAVVAHTICKTVRGAALVVLAFAAGGTGATIPAHLMLEGPALHSSMRFIGGTAVPERVETGFGRALVDAAAVPRVETLELPAETFAYLLSLGDYHPPLSGFYLLMLAMLCLAAIETSREVRYAQACLAASVVLCAIANGWTLPLQAALVLTWMAYRLREGRPPDWRMLAAGTLVAAVLCYPFLGTFAYNAAHYGVRIRLVPLREHTPPLLGLIVLWPILAAVLLPLVAGERRRWIVWSSGLWLGLLAFSELFYADDVYSGAFNRFNTTLKWWPWIQAGALLTAGAYGLASGSRALRYGTVALLALVSVYAVDMSRVLLRSYKADFGRLDGAAWIQDDSAERAILAFLRAQPPGIVLQRLEAGAFTPAPALVLFAGQTAFLGWPEHEKLWRGQRIDIDRRARDVAAFYAGELTESAEWLLQNRIDHVLWLKTEGKLPAGTYERIDEQIGHAYFWREYYRANDFRVGVWSRKGAQRPPG
jgi:uncharacterized membrane protein